MAVSAGLKPTFERKTANTLKADRVKHRITFNPNKALPGEILYVAVPRLDEDTVLVPGSLALFINLTLSGHADNFVLNNVAQALDSRLVVKFACEKLQDTNAYDLYELYEVLFLPKSERQNMFLKGIQSEGLCKIRLHAGDKKTSAVDKEKKPAMVYGNK